jgi:MFS family permease
MACFVLLALDHSREWEIYAAVVLLGAGIGLAFAAMANLIIENVGPRETGVATGMNTVTRTVGGAFGGAATASVVAGTGAFPTSHGYSQAFALCVVALFAGLLAGRAIPQRRPGEALGRHAVGDLEPRGSASAAAAPRRP